MPQGRKPKPTKLKLITGNPGKRALNTKEPLPETVSFPKPPASLKGEARKEWNRLGKVLFKLKLFTDLDTAAFASYCVAWEMFIKAQDDLNERGYFTKTDKGNLIQNPYLAVRKRASEQMNSLAAEFGLTPSLRSRLAITGQDKNRNGFAEL